MATLTEARGGFVGAADAAVVAAVDAVGAGVAAPPHAAARTSVARARPMFRLFIPISLSGVWVSWSIVGRQASGRGFQREKERSVTCRMASITRARSAISTIP